MNRGIIAAGGAAAGLAAVLLLNSAGPDATGTVSATAQGATGPTPTPATPQTYIGDVVVTRWGSVQVAATVTGDALTDVDLLQMPAGDSRSARISEDSGATLVAQALSIQSAEVDGVSGATYTSDGFRRSLQSALEEAGL